MIRKIILALLFAFAATPAFAQNTTCSNRPSIDNSNACANTRFVHGFMPTNIPPSSLALPNGQIIIGNGSNIGQSQTISGDCSLSNTGIITCAKSSALANPTTLIGLTPINGVATTGIRSDGAPALSQAISPTWTGLHNFIATSGGINVTGNANILSGYQETQSKFGTVFDIIANSATAPENTGIFNITSSVGAANLISAFKRALSVTAECNSGSSSCWGQTIATLIGAGGTQRGGIGLEADLNNFFGNFTGAPTSPYAANILLTGQNTDGLGHGGYSTCAICIEFAQNNNPMWNYGIALGTGGFQVFNTASISDFSNSPISYIIGGAHSEGIDFSVGTFSTAALVLGNTQSVSLKDTGGIVRSALSMNSSNVFTLGDTVKDIQIGPHIRSITSSPTFQGGSSSTAGCGTGGTISGSDLGGRLVMGTTPTNTCTLVWALGYTNAPSCTFTDNNLMSISIGVAPSATGFTVSNASTGGAGGHTISWTCVGLNGG